MSKKIIALSTMLLSVLLILISVGKVTMRGIVNCEATFYQTFFISEKSYYNLLESGKSSFVLITNIFFIGCLLLFTPNFLLFTLQKSKSIVLMIINTIGVISIFLLYQSYQYIFMMIIICILFTSNIIIQDIKKQIDRINLFIIILTIFILVANCYYLYVHLINFQLWINWDISDKLLEDMVHISRVNMGCFALWFVPYGILLIREIKDNGNKTVNS